MNKGITLISLVITIIVLLILAMVSIGMLMGENGILNQANNSVQATEEAEALEKILLISNEYDIEKYHNNRTVLEYLNSKVPKNLDNVIDNLDGTYTVEVDGYFIQLDSNGDIIGSLSKVKVEFKNIEILLNGNIVEDNTLLPGQLVDVSFTVETEGNIQKVIYNSSEVIVQNSVYKIIGVNGELSDIEIEIEVLLDGTLEKVVKTIVVTNKYKELSEVEKYGITIASQDTVITDEDGNKFTILAGFKIITEEATKVSEGIVAIDTARDNNEWVWIQVPKNIYITAGESIVDFTQEELDKIEADINNYVSDYKQATFEDEYRTYTGVYSTADSYDQHKHNTLKSVYQNEGFWFSRYILGGTNVSDYPRKSLPGLDMWVNRIDFIASQARAVGKQSTIPFGYHYDLVLKFIEENTQLTKEQVKANTGFSVEILNLNQLTTKTWTFETSPYSYSGFGTYPCTARIGGTRYVMKWENASTTSAYPRAVLY